LPAGLAQTFERVGVVFRPHPRHVPADMHVERGRCDRDLLLQRFLRFVDPTELASAAASQWYGTGTSENDRIARFAASIAAS